MFSSDHECPPRVLGPNPSWRKHNIATCSRAGSWSAATTPLFSSMDDVVYGPEGNCQLPRDFRASAVMIRPPAEHGESFSRGRRQPARGERSEASHASLLWDLVQEGGLDFRQGWEIPRRGRDNRGRGAQLQRSRGRGEEGLV